VVIAPNRRLALFAPAQGKVTAVGEGGTIAGYVIESISSTDVVLTGPGGARTLHTSFIHVAPQVIHALQEASAR
jgi:hypothetical protein